MNIVLIWIAVAVTANGPGTIVSREKAPFKDEAVCVAFAKMHIARMEDYTRGILHLDWSDQVSVAYRCSAARHGI